MPVSLPSEDEGPPNIGRVIGVLKWTAQTGPQFSQRHRMACKMLQELEARRRNMEEKIEQLPQA